MATKLPFKLAADEHVVTAYAQRAAGPGWANTPLWVIIQDGNGKLRKECLQPEQQSGDIYLLYGLSDTLQGLLVNEVERLLRARKVRKKRGSNNR